MERDTPSIYYIPRCFCNKTASVRLSEITRTLIYDCHYVKHANPWSSGALLEYKRSMYNTTCNLTKTSGKENPSYSPTAQTTQTLPATHLSSTANFNLFELPTISKALSVLTTQSALFAATIPRSTSHALNEPSSTSTVTSSTSISTVSSMPSTSLIATETYGNDNKSICESNSENKICVFHVHEPVWDELCRAKNLNKDHRDLGACPFFNLTFCIYFKTVNNFAINIPFIPKCYCKRNIFLTRVVKPHNKGRWYMACAHYNIPGARPKCTYFQWLDDFKFDKTKYQADHDYFLKFPQVWIAEPTNRKWRDELANNLDNFFDFDFDYLIINNFKFTTFFGYSKR
nr:12124_t:CDS:2 [Entrophospora candida]